MLGRDAAETLALKALTWLVGNQDLLGVFMGSTGVSEQDLKARAGEPDFMGAVLDFLLMDDRFVMEFCDANHVPYETLVQARASLPGGEQVHWT